MAPKKVKITLEGKNSDLANEVRISKHAHLNSDKRKYRIAIRKEARTLERSINDLILLVPSPMTEGSTAGGSVTAAGRDEDKQQTPSPSLPPL